MQSRLVDSTEYPELFKSTYKNLHLLNVNCILKFLIDGCFKGSTVNVYETVDDEANKLFTITLELLNDACLICILQSDSKDNKFLRDATAAILPKIQSTLNKYESYLCNSVKQEIANACINEEALMFYASEEQQEQLKKADLTLPEEFEFVELTSKDAEVIANEVIALKAPRHVEIIASKIAHMPAIGIRHKPSGELASYATNDGTGLISNLYTRKQFRRQGLAKSVEQKLSLENMKRHQILPFKAVGTNRPRVIAMSRDLYLWTVVPDHHGECVCRWLGRSKQPVEPVILYED